MSRKPVTTRTGRFFRLAGMTGSVASSYAARKARGLFSEESEESRRDYYSRMAEEIVDTLGELKGAVMKVGQIASQTQDFLPRELTDALQRLQKEAPTMEFAIIRDQIEQELGETLESLFACVDETPYAAASIGQVHAGKLHDGREVVIKVQYPGVDRSCDSDLRQLRTALRLGGLLKMPKESVDDLFNEIRDRLHEELDYEHEARNIQCFADQHRGDDGILIPEVIPERSSRRVLTMEKVEGDHISEVTRERYDQDTINRIGHRIFRTMADGLFRHRCIHGDPHAGNFAYRPDGTVVLYDFGCVKSLRPSTVAAYRNCIIDALNEDYAALDQHLIHLGARVEDHPPVDPEYYAMWRNIFHQPLDPANQPYDYGQSDIHQQVAANTRTVFQYLDAFKPPVESILIDRMIAGHYWMMKRLGVKTDFRPLLDEYLNSGEEQG
ncbi:AarF/ABC1/UbiB kinase family protein [Halospina sp. K52047b]|uniref:ABC1 kinase family protein n=1 Tax=Halospina sp. K52047b TaxID=2614160 RepID=UPI00124A353E|nr:AarF/ABC1/UbiB kinase family protein [Halospina sp. K52047b]KAA8980355.1 AarF/ABC1/UbiB kinase family protein [Halospina sp. K52047b]